ncbi:MAG: HEAT repeat domain-containing protein [Planctomycetota bacterium]
MNRPYHSRGFVPSMLGVALFVIGLTANCATADDAREKELIAILQSDAPMGEKALACKQLAVFGSDACVAELAKLLSVPEMASWARIALEAIPGDAADKAFLQSLSEINERSKIGVMQSLGERRTVAAVPTLASYLTNAPASVRASAAISLGLIGGQDAIDALSNSLSVEKELNIRSSVAEGLVRCAERQLKADNVEQAQRLYHLVSQADLPKQRIVEATRGQILAGGTEAIGQLRDLLAGDDPVMKSLALTVARQIPGSDITDALLEQVSKLSPPENGLLVAAIADRNDQSAIPDLLALAASDDKELCVAALEGLGAMGDKTVLAGMLAATMSRDSEIARTAIDALIQVPDPQLDDLISKRFMSARISEKPTLLKVIGGRRIEATKLVVNEMDSSDDDVRKAAVKALGQIGTLAELPMLIERATTSDHPDAEVSLDALKTACIRMPDRESCADALNEAMSRAPLPAKKTVLEVLAAMGGPTALKAVARTATADQPELQDTASRLLGSWMTEDASDVLLGLAKRSDYPYRIRALRGHLRIARQFALPIGTRVEMARQALSVADRDEEKRLVLDVARRYPHMKTLRLAVDVGQQPSLSDEARTVAQDIVKKIGTNADAKALLNRIPIPPASQR